MNNENDKYQNILAQLHELNRQNLLMENERNEQLQDRIEYLTKIIENKKDNNTSTTMTQIAYSLVALSIINIILIVLILFNLNTKSSQLQTNIPTETKISTIEDKKEFIPKIDPDEIEKKEETDNNQEDVVTFEGSNMHTLEDEKYEDIKPIIKKDTIYTCEDDNYNRVYRIPYTVEIKGKLYSDKFIFILQNDNGTRKCMINKNDM
ncbi:hypothetical protein [Halarcobacter ebronensis]|uniref:Uncharacterized protein n=1 Tax=Halarcobacter ebronensis TaxID=1462615 RepID=A0A4Q1AN43_9BACT|nr:hypothetical protein [Halarcobacter ebronensis]QKF81505.1 hypothetical protein AEBR_1008 [Halarcobacter ebronensis]RXK05436.1 hypothetical protein CRV07_07950 [Halarcobacter ebronensis]